MVKSEFAVNFESKVSEMVCCLSVLGMMGLWGGKDNFFCFTDIKVKMVPLTPLGDMGNYCDILELNVCEKAKIGCVICIFEKYDGG